MTPGRSRSVRLRQMSSRGRRRPDADLAADPRRGRSGASLHGGELVYVVTTEPASYDGHREGVRADPPARPGLQHLCSGSIPPIARAPRWSATSPNPGRSPRTAAPTPSARRGVKFHDGSDLTRRTCEASYDKIVNPPADVISYRKGQYHRPSRSTEAPGPTTVKCVPPEVAGGLADDRAGVARFSWIYRRRTSSPRTCTGTRRTSWGAAAVPSWSTKGAYWAGKKNPNYWDKGQAVPRQLSRAGGQGRQRPGGRRPRRAGSRAVPGFTPAERDSIVQASGPEGDGGRAPGTACSWWHEPREEALGRQARAPGAHLGPRSLPGIAGARQNRAS